jgi:tetratricopeptide (TPR) repeat protein
MNVDPNQAKVIFLEAVEQHEPDQWPAFLDQVCAGQPELRRRVEVLLDAHREAGTAPHQAAAQRPRPVTVDVPGSTECPGTTIGAYKLMEQVGEGGMGLVFVAEQQHPVRRKVALKVIKPGMDTRQVIARFEAERQALALMDHPNIAHVHDGGTTPAGRPYFVMELVKGVPITAYCDQNQVAVRERLALFVNVCQAVQHAHQKGIIHRDLKPSNVLVASHDGKPVVKVIDFGVAKAIGQQLTDKTVYTQLRQLVGTPLYMSPEQAAESSLDIDTRSDIYSLGVLLYELLTGTTPFAKERFRGAGYEEIRRIIREEEPPRPSTRISTLGQAATTVSAQRRSEPKRLSTLLRGDLDWIVMKALEKDRNRRYETASAFAADVQRYLHDEPVQACPPSAWYRLRKFARRNKGKLSVAVGVFLTVAVMAGSIGWAVRDRAAREEASERAETARLATVQGQVRDSFNAARTLLAENQLAAARQKLAEARAQLGNDRVALADLAAAVEPGVAELNRYQRFLDLIDHAHETETSPILDATLATGGSPGHPKTPPPIREWGRKPGAAVPFLLEALKRYEILERDDWSTTLGGGVLGKNQVEHIRRTAYEQLLWLADDVVRRGQEHRSGQTLSAKAAARAALAYLGKAESAHRPTLAFYVHRARCRKALGEKAAAQADRELAAKTPATMALDHYLLGREAYEAKQLADAVQAFEAALRLEPTHYWSMMNLGFCLGDLGQAPEDFVGAARVFSGCILKRPDHGHAYSGRAYAYHKLHLLEAALADYSKALDLDPYDSDCWIKRGVVYYDLGQRDKAVADYSRAIELDPKQPFAWNNRANAYLELGRPDKAVADYSRAIELDPTFVIAWHARGDVYRKLGQADKAVADDSRVIELAPDHADAWNNRGTAYLALGQPGKAVADFSKFIELDPKNAHAWYNRGIAYDRSAQADKAVADYSRAIDLDPQYADAWNNRAFVYLNLGQGDKAVADFSKVIDLKPKDAGSWLKRGNAYQKLGQDDKAVADFARAIDLDPKDPGPWYKRGAAFGRLDQPDKAVADFSRSVELKPNYVDAWHDRGIAYICLGKPEKALADFSRALKLNPKYTHAWCHRGLLYGDLGQWAKAVADLSRFIKLAPNDPRLVEVYPRRAQANSRLARFAQARTDYEAALEQAPTDAGVHNALAWLLATCPEAKLRDPGQAVELAKKAVQLAPKAGDYWRTLGVAHYRAGDEKAAVAAFKKSMELRKGGDAVDCLFLAMARRKLGNHVEARKAYDQAVQWLKKNQEALAKDKTLAEEFRRVRTEAEDVLELKKK